MRTKILATLAAAAILLPLVGAQKASATPAFARRYKAECSMCHWALYKLNGTGKAFLERGHRLPDEDGTAQGARLPLDNYASLSAQTEFSAQSFTPRPAGFMQSTSFGGTDISLIAGGPLSKRADAFANVALSSGNIDNLYGVYHFGVPGDGLQLRMGVITPYLFREHQVNGPSLSISSPFGVVTAPALSTNGLEANYIKNKWAASIGISDAQDTSNFKNISATGRYTYGPNGSDVGVFFNRGRILTSTLASAFDRVPAGRHDLDGFGAIANYLQGKWEADAGVSFGTVTTGTVDGDVHTNARDLFVGGEYAVSDPVAVYARYEYAQAADAAGDKEIAQGPVIGVSRRFSSGRVALEGFLGSTRSPGGNQTARSLILHWDWSY